MVICGQNSSEHSGLVQLPFVGRMVVAAVTRVIGVVIVEICSPFVTNFVFRPIKCGNQFEKYDITAYEDTMCTCASSCLWCEKYRYDRHNFCVYIFIWGCVRFQPFVFVDILRCVCVLSNSDNMRLVTLQDSSLWDRE